MGSRNIANNEINHNFKFDFWIKYFKTRNSITKYRASRPLLTAYKCRKITKNIIIMVNDFESHPVFKRNFKLYARYAALTTIKLNLM